jgi:hypothetical protein
MWGMTIDEWMTQQEQAVTHEYNERIRWLRNIKDGLDKVAELSEDSRNQIKTSLAQIEIKWEAYVKKARLIALGSDRPRQETHEIEALAEQGRREGRPGSVIQGLARRYGFTI